MKKILIAVFFGGLLLPMSMMAQDSGIGLGVILGQPTGVSFKAWTARNQAVDVAVAWAFDREEAIHVHADYLFHNFRLFRVEKGQFVLYYGIGGRIKAESRTRFGIRIPIGLSYLFEDAPVELFFELGPIMDLAPSTLFRMTTGVGVRYYFD
jgi:hypothetical protein